ncbi:MAG TPA: hypothetical protein VNF99_18850 [Stellaceae bacterium]|nr:hypothetical protein [Stellaceae bacterium]
MKRPVERKDRDLMGILRSEPGLALMRRDAVIAMRLERADLRMAFQIVVEQIVNLICFFETERGLHEQAAVFGKRLADQLAPEHEALGDRCRKRGNDPIVAHEGEPDRPVAIAADHLAIVKEMTESALVVAFNESVPARAVSPCVVQGDPLGRQRAMEVSGSWRVGVSGASAIDSRAADRGFSAIVESGP